MTHLIASSYRTAWTQAATRRVRASVRSICLSAAGIVTARLISVGCQIVSLLCGEESSLNEPAQSVYRRNVERVGRPPSFHDCLILAAEESRQTAMSR